MCDKHISVIDGDFLMGMFDYIQCDARLPVSKDAFIRCHNNPFQSKSIRLWEFDHFSERAYNEGCLTLTIRSDNVLIDPDGNQLDWTGDLHFYSGGKAPEFVATCVQGIITKIVVYGDAK